MVEIGGMPILWHIMKIYSHFGFHDFIVCLGYKGDMIKEWFAHYHLHRNDVTFDLRNNQIEYHGGDNNPWRVTLINTGEDTMTGGRIARIRPHLNNERFMLTYGDGVGDINIRKLLDCHNTYGRIATVTTVIPAGRFGAVEIDDNHAVTSFSEKKDNEKRVNGGFFVFEPVMFDYLTEGDATVLEQEPLRQISADSQLTSYPHEGFWHPMDTLSDKHKLEKFWAENPPWRLWD